ncbi:MAG: CoB--CoM heterodisulfide reductase iron-sulfur subunit A family protein [Candidatus Thorarchaeota archaeon]|jgi:heterodisulfide reductase subunit A-like polyferredoxin
MGTEEEPRIGVFVCHCGHNIAGTVDVEAVARVAQHYPHVEYSTDLMFTCSDAGQTHIKEAIAEHNLNKVVVASCSPRMHEPTFRRVVEEAGLNRYIFEQVNLREHCSWCHAREPEKATTKAEDLVRMAVARAALLEPLEVKTVSVAPHALVVGGGVTGLRAAVDIGSRGFKVTLVEKESELGGHLRFLSTMYPNNEKAVDVIDRMLIAAKAIDDIELMTDSVVVDFDGHIGNFETKIKNMKTGKIAKRKFGTVIVATGFEPFIPEGYYEYGNNPNIVTLADYEKMKSTGSVLRISDGRPPKKVMFIGCVGSREEGKKGHEHCSRYCCTAMTKAASDIKDETDEVMVLYDDLRTFGRGHEEIHRDARYKHVMFSKFGHTKKPKVSLDGEKIIVKWKDVLSDTYCEFEPDMLVLTTAMVPPAGTDEVGKLFSLTRSGDGFFNEEHIKLAPLTTHTAGIMIAGAAQSAKDATDSTTQASGAAAKATSLIARKNVEIESTVSWVDETLCSSCATCVQACPYGAIELLTDKEPQVAFVTEAKCKGCGTCAAACPSHAITMRHSTDEQIMSMVEAFLVPPPVEGGGE